MTINEMVFHSCTCLTDIDIPTSVNKIMNAAFYGCSSVKNVYIGKNVNSIGEYAFGGCPKLTDVYCKSENIPSTPLNAFEGSNSEDAILHVPSISISNYGDTEPWKYFKDIIALTDQELSIENVMNNVKLENDCYNLKGQHLNYPQKGINIFKTSDGKTKKVFVK